MNTSVRKATTWVLVFTMIAAPSASFAQEAGDGSSTQAYVPSTSFAAALVRPKQALTGEFATMLPTEIFTAAGQEHFGVDPMDIVEVLAVAEPPVAGPPGFGFAIRFAKPYRLEDLKLQLDWPTEVTEINGQPYTQSQHPMMPGFFMPDDKTLLAAPHAFMQQMLANAKDPKPSSLSRALSKADGKSDIFAVVMIEPVRPMLNGLLAQASAEIPPPFQSVTTLPNLIDAARLDARIAKSPTVALTLLSTDEAKAAELNNTLNDLLNTGEQMAMAQVAAQLDGDDPIQAATMRYSQRMTKTMLDALRPTQSGRLVTIAHDGQSQMQVATIGVLVALLLPAVQAAREASRRMSSANNLKQIAIAMHNYHDVYRKLPTDSFDKDGKPLLSWRVHILPFVEQSQLYEQFHLDEPWDSDHNSKLIDQIPQVYRNPTSVAAPHLANFLVPTGEGGISSKKEGATFRDILDGTSNTVMVVEVDDESSVVWTQPIDFEFSVNAPLQGLGSAHPGGFQVALADGSVRFISNTIDQQLWLHLLQMADGNPVRLD